jgi:hypothetical protein
MRLISGVQTTVILGHVPGTSEFRSSGVLASHESWSQQNGLLALLPTGTTIRNTFSMGAHAVGIEFFKGTEKSSSYGDNKTQGGLLSLMGRQQNVMYRLRAGCFRESDGVLTSRAAGALSLGSGSITSLVDLTTFYEISPNLCFANMLVYGCTRVRTSSRGRLLTPLTPLQTVEWRTGLMMRGSVNWGLFYTEPRCVVSALMRLKVPVEHCMDGTMRYEERTLNIRPNARERRLEAVIEAPFFSSFRFSAMLGYIHNRGHRSSAQPNMAVAFSVRSNPY